MRKQSQGRQSAVVHSKENSFKARIQWTKVHHWAKGYHERGWQVLRRFQESRQNARGSKRQRYFELWDVLGAAEPASFHFPEASHGESLWWGLQNSSGSRDWTGHLPGSESFPCLCDWAWGVLDDWFKCGDQEKVPTRRSWPECVLSRSVQREKRRRVEEIWSLAFHSCWEFERNSCNSETICQIHGP